MLERYETPILRIAEREIVQDPLDQRGYEAFKAFLPTWLDVLIAKMLRNCRPADSPAGVHQLIQRGETVQGLAALPGAPCASGPMSAVRQGRTIQ